MSRLAVLVQTALRRKPYGCRADGVRAALFVLVIAIPGAATRAQVAADDAGGISAALDALASANRSETPRADRVATTVYREDGTFSSVAHTVRWLVADDGRWLAFEIDAFRFYAEPGRLEGVYASEVGARTALVHENDGKASAAMLADAVPLGPMPQLWLPDADGTVNDAALGRIRFAEASRNDDEWLLIGGSPAGTVAVVIDARSGRVRSLEAQLRDGTVSQRMHAIDAGEPAAWRVTTAGRRIVQRLDQLVPAAPPLEPGTLIPDWSLQRVSGEGLSLDDWFAEHPPVGPWRLVLLCQRDDPAEAAGMVRTAAARIRDASVRRRADAGVIEQFWLRHTAYGIVVVRPDAAPPVRPAFEPGELPMAFSTQPSQTLDRVTPAEGVVAIAIDADRIIGAVVPLDGDGSIDRLLDAMQAPAARDE